MRRIKMTAAGALLAAAGLAACGSGSGVDVDQAWARPTPTGRMMTGIFATLDNNGDADDRLVGAQSAACGMVELHKTTMEDGVATMRPAEADQLVIPASGTLSLEPGGLHVMCMKVPEMLVEGETIDVTFEFEVADPVTLTIPITAE